VGALDGIRVLDVGQLVQGPQAAQTLADLGAEVIKIELPMIGDLSRWIPAAPGEHRSGFFHACNRGKRSLAVDLRTDDGREVFLRLVETADVVIANFRVGTLEGWGVGYDDARARNPRIVYGLGSLFGPDGPGADREGADLAAQAAGGLISTTGGDGRPISPVGVTIADHIASQNLTIGVLAALAARERTGVGQRVDVSLLGGQIWAQASEYTSYFLSGQIPNRSEDGHPYVRGVYGICPTADGHVALVGVAAARRAEFFALIGRADLGGEARFAVPWMSHDDHRDLWFVLSEVFRARTTSEWCALLDEHGFRYAPVNDYAAASSDPHTIENGYVIETEHPEWGRVRAVGSPIAMSETPPTIAPTSPALGEHTDEVLASIGYDAATIDALRSSGTIG
jgi:crotonobetainyl-CoA:carnitine CoA-transferase CaiB-like acyl-CoA transferase